MKDNMSETGKIVYERIREEIDKCGLSRKELAEELGCDVSTIAKHYNGDREVNSEFIVKYAKRFNVSADYLLGLTNAATNDKDIQFICDHTGLNAAAVSTLCELKEPLNIMNLVPRDIISVVNFLINDMDFQITDDGCAYRSAILPRLTEYLLLACDGDDQEVYVTQNGMIFESREKAKEELKKIKRDIKTVYSTNAVDLVDAAFFDLLTDAIKQAKERYRGEQYGNDQKTQ